MLRAFLLYACFPLYLTGCTLFSAQTNLRSEIEAHYKKAQEALNSKQDSLAAAEFREILRLDPRNASAHANLGVIAYAHRDYAQASREFRAALAIRPELWNAQGFLGMSELRSGHGAEARSLLEESFKHVQDAKLKSELGMDLITVYYQTGELDRAVDIVRMQLRARPQAPEVLYTAYRTYSDLAARALSELAQAAPESAQMHQILAQSLAAQDDFPGAVAQYRKALEINPQLSELHYELGQAILATSQEEPARREAEKEFKLDLASDPTNALSDYMLGEIEWLRSRRSEALQYYTLALQLRPEFADAHIAAGKALTSLDRPAEALQHLLEAARLDPRNEVTHYRLAQAYRKLGRNQESDRETQIFRQLRGSHEPVRALFQQVQERTVLHQTISPNEPQ